MAAAIVSDPLKPVIVAEQRDNGGVLIRQGSRLILLSADEVQRLMEFINGNGQLQVHPCGKTASAPS